MSNSDLFLQAFSGKQPEEKSQQGGSPLDPDSRSKLFEKAFRTEKADPTPHLGGNWKIDTYKTRNLSFSELYSLGELQGKSFDELPDWVIQGGYAVPSKEYAKREKQLTDQTGLDTVERRQLNRNFEIRMEILLDYLDMPALSSTDIPMRDLQENIAKYGEDMVMSALREMSPEGAEMYSKKLTAHNAAINAEKAAQMAQKVNEERELSVREEIQDAQRKIAEMNADTSSLGTLSTEEIQAELTRRLNTETRRSIEEMEG